MGPSPMGPHGAWEPYFSQIQALKALDLRKVWLRNVWFSAVDCAALLCMLQLTAVSARADHTAGIHVACADMDAIYDADVAAGN